MSYNYRVLYDLPHGFWPFDGDFSDLSGRGNTATSAAVNWTTSPDRPLVARGLFSLKIAASESISLPISDLMIQNYHLRPFSLEVWFRSRSATGTGNLLTRDTGGITVSGDTLTFTCPFASAVSVTWRGVVVGEAYHVVATYDTQSIGLYVNGDLVASADIPTSTLSGGFTATSANMTMSSGTGFDVRVDAPAVYNYALSPTTIEAHYGYGTNHNFAVDSSGSIVGGNIFECYDGWTDEVTTWQVDDALDWALGSTTGKVAVLGDTLVNYYDNLGTGYQAGTWIGTFDVPAEAITTAGSNIYWTANKYTGSDYTVDVSTDNTNWTTVTNFSQPFGAINISAGQTFYVRITFAASATQTIINSLRVVIFRSKGVTAMNNSACTLTLNNATNITIGPNKTNAALFADNSGYNLVGSTSKITVPQDTAFGGYKAVEFFARWDTSPLNATIFSASTGASLTTNGTNGNWIAVGLSVYVDGVLVTGAAPTPGRWHHVVILLSSLTTAGFSLGNNSGSTAGFQMRISHITAFFNVLTTTQITALYQAAVGYTPSRTIDSSIATITEHTYAGSGNAYLLYAYNWSISGSG